MTASVLLLRHGETEWNRDGRIQGRDDSPLTPRGIEHADALARAVRALGVQRVLASPLGRACATAERVAAATECAPIFREALVEMDVGSCTGLTLDEVRARYPGLLEERAKDRWRHAWPGGESYASVCERVSAGLAGDLPLFTDAPTVVVAHQSVNRAIVHWLLCRAPNCGPDSCGQDSCGPASPVAGEALSSEQPADVIVRVDEDGEVWHAWVSNSNSLDWKAGLFRRKPGSASEPLPSLPPRR